MPTLLKANGFRFFFYSSEGSEPAHIHVSKGDADGKIWLEPDFQKAYMHGFTFSEEKKLTSLAFDNATFFKEKWYEYFNKK